MYKDVELRKLPVGKLCSVVSILETNDDWKKVMSLIPKDPQSEHFEPKYNNEHMRLIEEHARDTKTKCAEILFDEWGTSGRIRPTLGTLLHVVLKAQIFRAADEIATILQEEPPQRPNSGPAAPINTDITLLLNDESMELRLNSMDTIKTNDLDNTTNTNDHALCNDTTRQMKSVSDFIKFSADMNKDMQNVKAKQSYGYQSKTEVKTEDSDMIQFSKSTLNTKYYPHFSALLPKSSNISEKASSTTVSVSSAYTESDTDSFRLGNITPKNEVTEPQYIPGDYQTSLPNIDIFSAIDSGILEDTNLIQFEYRKLEEITNRFSENLEEGPYGPIGKIGSGGFGEVFAGIHENYGPLAVKKVRSYLQIDCKPETAMKLFNAEVKSLSLLQHNNIVPILGFSIDGPSPCVVCKFIDGGSLEQKLAAKILSEIQRIDIMLGTAEGLNYIHNTVKPSETGRTESESVTSSKRNCFLHGDVKSANILLTKDCVPKLCDFGLAKQYNSTFITKSMMGTSAYMAPEGFSGTITQKNDIFSYGIVLLELLTGLRPIVISNSENINIKNYVEENCINDDITNLLDPVVKEWTKADKVYELAKKCLEPQRNKRPSIDEICNVLYQMKTN